MNYNIILYTALNTYSEALPLNKLGNTLYKIYVGIDIPTLITEILPMIAERAIIDQVGYHFAIIDPDSGTELYNSGHTPYDNLRELYYTFLDGLTQDYNLNTFALNKLISELTPFQKATPLKNLFNDFDYGFKGDGYEFIFDKLLCDERAILLTCDGMEDIKLSYRSEDIDNEDFIHMLQAICLQIKLEDYN